MPLPTALIARLKRRGLVKANVNDDSAPEEEVIAEDYDDHSKTRFNDNSESADRPNLFLQESILENLIRESGGGDRDNALGCPNKYNIYHICTKYCHEHWTLKHPSPTTERKRIKMMKKYPLPNGWKEVYDAGVGRHYYWRMGTEDVTWLPPTHPRAKVTPPANKLRAIFKEELALKRATITNIITKTPDVSDGEDEDDDEDDSDEDDLDEEEVRIKEKKPPKKIEKYDKITSNKWRIGKRAQDLDPMDPAAYSECGRGTWSTGLEKKNEAKTGADVTASGPLYQMRPYPSPGAVLRMNAGGKPGPQEEKDADEEDD